MKFSSIGLSLSGLVIAACLAPEADPTEAAPPPATTTAAPPLTTTAPPPAATTPTTPPPVTSAPPPTTTPPPAAACPPGATRTQIVPAAVSGLPNMGVPYVHDGKVYFALSGEVRVVPVTGGTATPVDTYLPAGVGALMVAVNDAGMYFASNVRPPGGMYFGAWARPRSEVMIPSIFPDPDPYSPTSGYATTADKFLTWSSSGALTISIYGATTGVPTLATTISVPMVANGSRGILVGKELFLYGYSDAAPYPFEVRAVDIVSGANRLVTSVAATNAPGEGIGSIDVRDGSVFFADLLGTVRSAPVAGGTSTVALDLGARMHIRNLFVASSAIFYTAGTGATGTSALHRFDRTTGATTLQEATIFGAITSDRCYAYFVGNDGLFRTRLE